MTERGWDNAGVNILVGVLFGQIAAPIFGYSVAKADMKIDTIKHPSTSYNVTVTKNAAMAAGISPEIATSKWRDQVADIAPQTEVAR